MYTCVYIKYVCVHECVYTCVCVHVGGGHDRTVKVKRAVARKLCTPGL